jgi:hypothetical protein
MIELAKAIGMGSSPWVIRAYLTLLFTCVGMIILAVWRMPADATDHHPASKLLALSMDSFKIVLGAVLGAMSATVASH